jgi:hypothetical protein
MASGGEDRVARSTGFASGGDLDSFIALTPDEQAVAAGVKAVPKLADRVKDVAGKVWGAPNTAAGLIYGLAGTAAGALMGTHPKIVRGANSIDFVNNPLGGVGAITLGNTTTWNGNPYVPDGEWVEDGHTIPQHEEQHTIQSQQLGPLYLPSNLLGGLNALIHGEDWHGAHNWNERGPKADPPTPWAPRSGWRRDGP